MLHAKLTNTSTEAKRSSKRPAFLQALSRRSSCETLLAANAIVTLLAAVAAMSALAMLLCFEASLRR